LTVSFKNLSARLRIYIKGRMLLTRKAEFSASHVCRNPAWSDEENRRVYGANANPNGHGHNYVVEVTVEGSPDPVTGMVFDLKALKEIMVQEVVDPMDHRFLNREVAPFDRVVPTTENIVVEVWRRLDARLRQAGAHLSNVRLYETQDLFVDYGGEPCS
jgi:6-pyruvoyltetrahydropterin/6-carboxytetrahydropterin synthase